MPKTRITLNGLGSLLDHMWITSGSHIQKTVAHMLSRVRLPVGVPLCGNSRSLSLSLRSPLSFRGAGIGPSLLSDPWGALMVQLGDLPPSAFAAPLHSGVPPPRPNSSTTHARLSQTGMSWCLNLPPPPPSRCGPGWIGGGGRSPGPRRWWFHDMFGAPY